MDRRSSGCAGPFFLGEADCPVAPLLAMTRGGGPCTRRHLPVFCMSLRASAHTGAAIRVPAEMPGKLAAARANSYQLRICLRYYSLPCAAAGVTDCHVASLLAMTRGGGPCTRRHLPVFCMSLRTSAHTGAAIRVPAGIPDKLAAARANSYQLRICLRYYSLPCAAAGVTDCHVAPLLAMTCRNMRLSAVATAWCQANLSRFRIRPRRCFLLCPAAGVTDCHVAPLLAMTC